MARTGIYKIINIENNRIYIGSSVSLNRRWATHLHRLRSGKHHNQFLLNDYRKCGEEKFEFSILEEVLLVEEIINREQYYLDIFYDKQDKCYNLRPIADSNRGRKLNAEQKAKLSQTHKILGTKPTSECIQASIRSRRENGISQEARQNLSKAATLRAEKYKEKISLGLKEVWTKPGYREKMSEIHRVPRPERKKKVAQYDLNDNLIQIYDDAKEAAKATNLHFGSIRQVIYGNRNSVNGFKWRYV